MRVEIISIGDELLTGHKMDTNSVYLCDKLDEIGVDVTWKSSVGDHPERIKEAFGVALGRADLIVATGGLGPTCDDLTVRSVAELLSRKLCFHPEIAVEIEERFRRRGMRTPQSNRSQAFLPHGATILANSRGMAPGILLEEQGRLLFLLPGVPTEMRQIFEDEVLPVVREKTERVVLRRVVRTTGIAESEISDRLDSLPMGGVKIAFLPQFVGVDLRLTASAEDRAKIRRLVEELEDVEEEILNRLGQSVYGFDEDTMEMIVGHMLVKRKKTLAVAESCTGGLIGHWLTNVPGSSDYFERGVIAYSNRAKTELLGVTPETIEDHGAVSPQTAEAMARGVRERSKTDYGLSVTGVAGPTGGSPEKPIGLVYVGLAHADGVLVERFRFGDHRLENKERTAQAALNLLRLTLLKQ